MSKRPVGCLFEVLETLVLTLVIFLIIQNFVAQPYRVQQQSMEHTLEPDQYVLVDKLTPRVNPYQRGDIVVFAPPPDWGREDGTPYIKRVIGVANDVVSLADGKVTVNGTTLAEPYVYDGQATEPLGTESTWRVGEGELFVMGDHRMNSQDSRAFGPITVESVVGRAWLRYWPVATFGILPTPAYPEVTATAP